MSQRIRQIKPDFFSDPDVAELSVRARLTYIGLWTIADDAGWLPRLDPVEIGHLLYGYESARMRERWIVEDLITLQQDGHLFVEICGHACIPTLPRHQRVSKDRRVEMNWQAHETLCRSSELRGTPRNSAEESQSPTSSRKRLTDTPDTPDSGAIPGVPPTSAEFPTGKERNGKERNGTVDARKAQESDFRDKVGPVPGVLT